MKVSKRSRVTKRNTALSSKDPIANLLRAVEAVGWNIAFDADADVINGMVIGTDHYVNWAVGLLNKKVTKLKRTVAKKKTVRAKKNVSRKKAA